MNRRCHARPCGERRESGSACFCSRGWFAAKSTRLPKASGPSDVGSAKTSRNCVPSVEASAPTIGWSHVGVSRLSATTPCGERRPRTSANASRVVRWKGIELLPKASDPQIDQIVDNIVLQSVATTTRVSVPEMEKPARETPSPAAAESADSDVSSTADGWQVVAYALAPADVEILQQSPACRSCRIIAVDGAAQRRAACEAFREAQGVGNALVLAAATTVPSKPPAKCASVS